MIKVYGQVETSFSGNGDVVLQPLKAKVHKEDNGDYYLDLECGLEYVDFIVEGNIIVVDLPQGMDAFRIHNVTKTDKKITTRCWHLFYDSENYLIENYSAAQEIDCDTMLEAVNGETVLPSPFYTSADVSGSYKYECKYTSLYAAIIQILNMFGGHLVRDRWNIAINQSTGQDNGVVVRYGKNIKEISCSENWNDVCTRVFPIGNDNIMLDSLDPSEIGRAHV